MVETFIEILEEVGIDYDILEDDFPQEDLESVRFEYMGNVYVASPGPNYPDADYVQLQWRYILNDEEKEAIRQLDDEDLREMAQVLAMESNQGEILSDIRWEQEDGDPILQGFVLFRPLYVEDQSPETIQRVFDTSARLATVATNVMVVLGSSASDVGGGQGQPRAPEAPPEPMYS